MTLFKSISWKYKNPVEIIFGENSIKKIAESSLGKNILLVTTPGFIKRPVYEIIVSQLGDRLSYVYNHVKPNPCVHQLVKDCEDELAGKQFDEIIALGGGSAMDTAKFFRVALSGERNADRVRQSLLGHGSLDFSNVLRLVSIPTTSGTGSEVTPFATIWDSISKKKYSLNSFELYSEVAVLDPVVTLGSPDEITLSSGMDALSQGLEAIWNNNWNALSASYGTRAVQIAVDSLKILVKDPDSLPARKDIMEASLLSGLAISQTRTALAHSMSYPITANLGLPHGFACSFMLPSLLEYNSQIESFQMSDFFGKSRWSSSQELKSEIIDILAQVDMGKYLNKYSVSLETTKGMVDEMFTPGRADNNVRNPTNEDIANILTNSF